MLTILPSFTLIFRGAMKGINSHFSSRAASISKNENEIESQNFQGCIALYDNAKPKNYFIKSVDQILAILLSSNRAILALEAKELL